MLRFSKSWNRDSPRRTEEMSQKHTETPVFLENLSFFDKISVACYFHKIDLNIATPEEEDYYKMLSLTATTKPPVKAIRAGGNYIYRMCVTVLDVLILRTHDSNDSGKIQKPVTVTKKRLTRGDGPKRKSMVEGMGDD